MTCTCKAYTFSSNTFNINRFVSKFDTEHCILFVQARKEAVIKYRIPGRGWGVWGYEFFRGRILFISDLHAA